MIDITFLFPCLNEESSLGFCLDEAKNTIERLNLNAELLVADNGSTDQSRTIAEKKGARVVSVPEKGYGAALIGGIRAAEGNYIIMADADGSYDLTHIEPFLEKLKQGYDMVVGNRFWGGIQPGAMSQSHYVGVKVLSALARWRCKAPVGDFHCGLRAFSREPAQELGLSSPGMEFATEIIVAFAESGKKVCQVPTVLRKDLRGRKSHLRTVRDGCRHLRYIVCP